MSLSEIYKLRDFLQGCDVIVKYVRSLNLVSSFFGALGRLYFVISCVAFVVSL